MTDFNLRLGTIFKEEGLVRGVRAFCADVFKNLLLRAGYHIGKGYGNRFQGIELHLRDLAGRGYRPLRIIDGGAYVGSFSRTAHAIFPEAQIDMIDPQPKCQADLEKLTVEHGFTLHPYALAAESGTALLSCEANDTDAGAHVIHIEDAPEPIVREQIEVEETTLDTLFGSALYPKDRTLLKLDLEGLELDALKGGLQTLKRCEIILIEITLLQLDARPGMPRFAELVAFFDQHGFDLFDVASLSSRPRDGRLRQGDWSFVRRDSALWADRTWE